MGRLLALLAVTLLPALAQARTWNGVTPMETKRADLITKFGEPSKAIKQGEKEVVAYIGPKAIKGTTQAQFTVNAAGVVESIVVFPATKLEVGEIEEMYGKSCEKGGEPQSCYVRQLADDFKVFFWFKRMGLIVFFAEDKKTVHSFMFNTPVAPR